MKNTIPKAKFLLCSSILLLLSGCQNAKNQTGMREFYHHQKTATDFSYEDKLGASKQWYRMMKIATSAETRFYDTNELIYRSTLVSMDTKDSNKPTLSFKSEYLKDGKVVFTADVERDLSSCTVNAVVFNGKYRSEHIYPNGRRELPLMKTTDVATGKTVSETKNIEIIGDGSFRVEEINYRDGKEVFHSLVRRHAGSGLIVEENVKDGALDVDYHHYELLLHNWSQGRM